MPSKSTITDVAQLAGVSTATVDRVLNERGGVSEAKHKKVVDAARALGLNRILPRGSFRSVRVEVILNRPELPFIARMNEEFKRLAQQTDRDIIIQRRMLDKDDPKSVSEALRTTIADSIIIYAKTHPLISETIAQLEARDVRVVTMISDVPSSARSAYAGMDHFSGGRTAAFFMQRFAPAPKRFLLLRDEKNFHAHDERITGFRSYLQENTDDDSEILDVLDGGDDRNRTELVLRQTFAKYGQVSGIYNVGGANLGVEAAIKSQKWDVPPIYIGHELTKHTERLLREGIMTLTIDQNPEQQSQYAFDLALHLVGHRELPAAAQIDKSPIPFTIYTAENIPKGIKFDWM